MASMGRPLSPTMVTLMSASIAGSGGLGRADLHPVDGLVGDHEHPAFAGPETLGDRDEALAGAGGHLAVGQQVIHVRAGRRMLSSASVGSPFSMTSP